MEVLVKYGTAALTILFLFFSIILIFISIRFRHLDFNRLWRSRLLLCVLSSIWFLGILLGMFSGNLSLEQDVEHGLCRTSVVLSFGIGESMFLLCVTFILRMGTSSKKKGSVLNPNWIIFVRTVLWSSPVLLFLFLILLGDELASGWSGSGLVLDIFDEKEGECSLPLFGVIGVCVFLCIVLLFLWITARNLFRTLHNCILQHRLVILRNVLISFVPVGLICLGVANAFPSGSLEQLSLNAGSVFCSVVCCGTVLSIMVIKPFNEIIKAQKICSDLVEFTDLSKIESEPHQDATIEV